MGKGDKKRLKTFVKAGCLVLSAAFVVAVLVVMPNIMIEGSQQFAYGLAGGEGFGAKVEAKLEEGEKNYVEYVEFAAMYQSGGVDRVILGRPLLYFYKEFDNSKDMGRYLNETPNDSGETSTLYSTAQTMDDDLPKDLAAAGVTVVRDDTDFIRSWITDITFMAFTGFLPLVALMILLYISIRRLSPDRMIGKQQALKSRPDVKLEDVIGIGSLKADIRIMLSFLRDREKFTEIGASPPKGFLFVGPPGVGKTMLAKAIAHEADVPFFEASGSDFDELYVGVGARRVRDLFKQARDAKGAIIFIDEIDSLCKSRSALDNRYANATINAFLKEMDGFSAREGVIVIGATNRLEDIDSAATRPGRFDRTVSFVLPHYKDRVSLAELYLAKVKSDGVDAESIASRTAGCSGADIAGIINEAAFIAVAADRETISPADVSDAMYKIFTRGNKR